MDSGIKITISIVGAAACSDYPSKQYGIIVPENKLQTAQEVMSTVVMDALGELGFFEDINPDKTYPTISEPSV